MNVKFTFYKQDQTEISLTYQVFDNEHSKLWLQSISDFVSSNKPLIDNDRIYNFKDYELELKLQLDNCNSTIELLNNKYKLNIPNIRLEKLQEDVNFVHTFFVDSDRRKDDDLLWSKLNDFLHGLEIIQRGKNKKLQGQVFCSFIDSVKYDIPDDSYQYFTTKKNYGYCYANYPHVGRHILEMFNAKDTEAHDDHVLPMNKIAGDFYLWFGNTTSWMYDLKRRFDIKRWFKQNHIDKIVNKRWGDPKLAIGWLPVAKLNQHVDKEQLIGICQIKQIEIT